MVLYTVKQFVLILSFECVGLTSPYCCRTSTLAISIYFRYNILFVSLCFHFISNVIQKEKGKKQTNSRPQLFF